MTQEIIYLGERPNDRTGDKLRAALDKTNDNFAELYELTAPLETLSMQAYTPVLQFGGGPTGITYLTRDGGYFRLSNLVHVRASFILSSKGVSNGLATISLPFQIFNPQGPGSGLGAGALIGFVDRSDAPGPVIFRMTQGLFSVSMAYFNAGSVEEITNAHFRNDTQVSFSGTYLTF